MIARANGRCERSLATARPLARWLLLAVLPLLAHCASAPRLEGIVPSYAIPPAESTRLDQMILQRLGTEPGVSGVQLVQQNALAFAYRAGTAAAAERSIDVQYYLWNADFTGKLLAAELMRAAERGVRVRVLVDDLDARANHDIFAVADLHPNIEVRIFNPFYDRYGVIGQWSEFVLRGTRLNRRMHNKAWIADNRVAIVGGRNIGDEYFGASKQMNFSDTDVLLAGPIVAEVSREFDEYWNSVDAVPVSRFDVLPPEAAGPAGAGQGGDGVPAGSGRDAIHRSAARPEATGRAAGAGAAAGQGARHPAAGRRPCEDRCDRAGHAPFAGAGGADRGDAGRHPGDPDRFALLRAGQGRRRESRRSRGARHPRRGADELARGDRRGRGARGLRPLSSRTAARRRRALRDEALDGRRGRRRPDQR